MRKIFMLRPITLVLPFVLLMAASHLQAATDTGMDIVLVLDNSGSMRSHDIKSLRVEAAKMFVSLLSDRDRASVVHFSGSARIVTEMLPLTREANRTTLFNGIDRITSQGAHTNITKALQRSYELLKQVKRDGRKQHIILMSDGEMDVGKKATDQQLIDRMLSDISPKLKKAHIKLHTITFRESSGATLLQLASADTKGSFNQLRGESAIHEVFETIFEQSAKPDMLPLKEDGFAVDSAISEMTIVVSKYKPGAKIAIESPDGETYFKDNHPSRFRWHSTKGFDLITIRNPSTGYWLVKFSEGGNRAYIVTDLKLVAESPNEVQAGNSFKVIAWLEKNGKSISQSAITKSTRYRVTVVDPKGGKSTHNLKGTKSGKYEREFRFSSPGTYKLEVSSISETFDRQRSAFVRILGAAGDIEPFAMLDDKYAEKTVEPTEKQESVLAKSTSEPSPADQVPNTQVQSDASSETSTDTVGETVQDKAHPTENESTKSATIPEVEKEKSQEDPNTGKKVMLVFLILNVLGITGFGIWYYIRRKRNQDGFDLGGDNDDIDTELSVHLTEVNMSGIDEDIAMEEDLDDDSATDEMRRGG